MLPDASNLGEFGLGYCLGRRGACLALGKEGDGDDD